MTAAHRKITHIRWPQTIRTRLLQPTWMLDRIRERRATLLILAIAVALMVMTWPVEEFRGEVGLDPSWEIAIHLASRLKLDFGTELVFTYGPLGFLAVPRWVSTPTFVLSLAFVAAAHSAIAAALLVSLRATFGLVVATVIAYVVLAVAMEIQPTQALVVVALYWSVAVLNPGRASAAVTSFALVMGAASAVMLLMKFNDGVVFAGLTALALMVVAIVGRPRVLGLGAVAFGVTFTVSWMISGQQMADIPAYLSNSVQIASGYSASMGVEQAGREWEYAAAAFIASGMLLVVARASVHWPALRRAGAVVATALVLFGAYKHGFVRHDGHSIYFFMTAALMAPTGLMMGRASWMAVGTLTVSVLAVSTAGGTSVTDALDPSPRVTALLEQVRTVVVPSERDQAYSTSLEEIRAELAIPSGALEEIRGHRVHIDPWEASVAWAFSGDFDWAPVPVFQSYFAYTAQLDRLNANFLVTPSGPDRILRERPQGIDGRNPHWESPAYMLAIVCNFREAWVGERWQVLERIENRCGPPRVIGRSSTLLGSYVTVPPAPPGTILVATIRGLEDDVLDSLVSTLFKTAPYWANFDERAARLVPGSLENGLILQLPRSANYSAPFSFPAITRSLGVYPGWSTQEKPDLLIEFSAIPLEPASR